MARSFDNESKRGCIFTNRIPHSFIHTTVNYGERRDDGVTQLIGSM